MRIIFSRKGFDSSAGGVPSPLIGGRPLSLPIPTRMPTRTRFLDLANGISEIVCDLTGGRIRADHPCHLDPDLDAKSLGRLDGWRGVLGQVGAAQAHLANNSVGPGDIFLFWGLFRSAIRGREYWHFTGAPEHRIFGWLQVGEVLAVGKDPEPVLARYPWLVSHPHVARGWPQNNTVYIAREALELPGTRARLPGFGLMRSGIRLTSAVTKRPSTWSVPTWLNPRRGGVGMTYHPSHRWSPGNEVRSAARGQEFIAAAGNRADALVWLTEILETQA